MSALEILNLEDMGGNRKERGIQFRVLEYYYEGYPTKYIPQWNGDPDNSNKWIDISTSGHNTLQGALAMIDRWKNNRPLKIKEVYKSY